MDESQRRITKGCNPPDNDKYCPDDSVTRGQMAAFLRRLAEAEVVAAATAVQAGDADHAVDADHAMRAADADHADNAQALGGFDASEYWRKGEAVDASSLGGIGAGDYWTKLEGWMRTRLTGSTPPATSGPSR